MPRRTSTRTTTADPEPELVLALPSKHPLPPDTVLLRQQWKWAAFSQFFFTFAHLFAMNDVTLLDIENDLVGSTNVFLPRVMQRLLYTLTQDRKISPDNWQTILRKQYYRRDPKANPIGREPSSFTYEAPSPSAHPDVKGEVTDAIQSNTSMNPAARSQRSASVSTARQNATPQPKFSQENKFANGESAQSTHSERQSTYPPDHAQDTDDESKDWLDLSMLEKLDSMHLLTEWQFQNPMRLRTTMRNDDEAAEWRIEPIGYDAKANAYWLIGADRLWIQRAPPRPKGTKRKRPEGNGASAASSRAKKSKGQSTKRPRLQEPDVEELPQRGSRSRSSQPVNDSRGGRAAKVQAKQKLESQAKELVELNNQADFFSGRRSSRRQNKEPQPSSSRRPVGTRLSARLRGAEDEWQAVPQEWLLDASGADGAPTSRQGNPGASGASILKTGLESDRSSISELTELSEEPEEYKNKIISQAQPTVSDAESTTVKRVAKDVSSDLPGDFLEWETICVTLYDWEHIAERFEKATHYAEKALYKVLINHIVPAVTDELREIERKRRFEEALVHRKRSSRIAIKESEKEEARLAARKRAEEAEKMSRARRLEVRLQKEEADRERREAAREQRKKEREAKEPMQRQDGSDGSEKPIDVVDDNVPSHGDNMQTTFQSKFHVAGSVTTSSHSGSRTPIGEEWELDCEICNQRGFNLDDGRPMMSCGRCSKWQHIPCHDAADMQAHRPRRNWNFEEFFCQKCRTELHIHGSLTHQPQKAQNGTPLSTMQGHLRNGVPTTTNSLYQTNLAAPISSDPYLTAQGSSATANGGQPSVESHNRSSVTSGLLPQSFHNRSNGITFAHYQPQHHGFSASQSPERYNSNQVQPYSQSLQTSSPRDTLPHTSTVQIPGSQQPAPGWNVSTPAGYNGTIDRPSYKQEWRPHPPVSSLPEQPTQFSQFRYHPTSYQSPS